MRTALPVLSYALAGGRIALPEARRQPLPPEGALPRGARLPELAVALARRALAGRPAPEHCSVQFGTSLGCLTETGSFVENMIRAREEEPKPRAFSASVHNAIASRLAIAVGAKGPNRTFTHGEVSFAQAALAAALDRARGFAGHVLLGGLDESTPLARRVCTKCAADEGGAVLLLGGGAGALAVLREVVVTREPDKWMPELASADHDVVLLDAPSYPGTLPTQFVLCRPLVGDHPSACASAAALATALLCGDVAPSAVGLDRAPRSVAVLGISAWGDLGLLVFGRPE